MKATLFFCLAAGTMILLGACSQPQVSTPNGSGTTITNKIPVIGFANQGVSKAIVPATMTTEDINYFVYCPALTGFNSSASGITEGQVLNPQTFLNTTVVFTVNTFTGGTNGIPSGTRFSGVLSDSSGTFVVELNSAGTSFWFEEKLFLDDPNSVVISDHSTTSKSVIHMISSGTIHSDNSVLGVSSMSFYSVLGTGLKILAVAPQCELYLGPWSSSLSGVTGAGTAFLKSTGTSTPAPSYGTASQPSGVLDGTMVNATVDYIIAYANSGLSFSPQYALFYKTTSDTHPTQFLSGTWNSVVVNTPALAKANLPSDIWRGYSVIDTF
jgi:hypothetical protein